MGLQFIDGFDLYPTGAVTGLVGNKWSAQGTIVTSQFRNGRAALQNDSQSPCVRAITAPVSRILYGAAVRVTALTGETFSGGVRIIGATSYLTVLMDADANTGQLELRRGNGNANLGISAPVVTANTWNYLLIDYNIATATCDIYWNRTLVLSVAGIAGIGAISSVGLARFGLPAATNSFYDDVFVWTDPAAPDLAALLLAADFEARATLPSANGATQDWSFTGGASAFESINNAPYNTGQYIEAASALDVSQFDYANVSAGAFEVFGAQHYYYAQKTTAGAGNIQAEIEGGAGADNAQATTFAYYTDVYQTNPGTGTAWIPADLSTVNGQFERTA